MRRLLMAVAALVFLTGCSPAEKAQPRLPRIDITIDTPDSPAKFTVEVAANEDQRRDGLMFRKEMGENQGMLFEYDKEQLVSFWMKNTILPLDMLFIKKDGTISTIAENTVPYSLDPVSSSEPVVAVLEINAGRARALGIVAGAKVHAKFFGSAP